MKRILWGIYSLLFIQVMRMPDLEILEYVIIAISMIVAFIGLFSKTFDKD